MKKMCNKNVILKYSICFGIVVSVWALLAIGIKYCETISFFCNIEQESNQKVNTVMRKNSAIP